MLTFCQGLEGKYLSNDVLPKVQLVLFVKELHQEELGLWFPTLLNASAHTDFYPLTSLPGKKITKITQIYIYVYKKYTKSKAVFWWDPPFLCPAFRRGRNWDHCMLSPVWDVRVWFFSPLTWVWIFRHWISGWQSLQGDFWAGAPLEGEEEIQTPKVIEKERRPGVKNKWKRCLEQGD